jgi:hypothetical protein
MSDLYSGKSATGTEGIFAPLMKYLLESMMEGELAHHLKQINREVFLIARTENDEKS